MFTFFFGVFRKLLLEFIYLVFKFIHIFNENLIIVLFNHFLKWLKENNIWFNSLFELFISFFLLIYYVCINLFISLLYILKTLLYKKYLESLKILARIWVFVLIYFFLGEIWLFDYVNVALLPSLLLYCLNNKENTLIHNIISFFNKIIIENYQYWPNLYMTSWIKEKELIYDIDYKTSNKLYRYLLFSFRPYFYYHFWYLMYIFLFYFYKYFLYFLY